MSRVPVNEDLDCACPDICQAFGNILDVTYAFNYLPQFPKYLLLLILWQETPVVALPPPQGSFPDSPV